MEYVALITIIERTILCVMGITVLLSGGHLFAVGVTYATTNFIVFGTGFLLFRSRYGRVHFAFHRAQAWSLLREASPFFLASFFSVLYNRTDIYFLSSLRPLAEVGWYNAAFRIIDAQMFIPVSIVASIFPILSRHYESSPDHFLHLHSRSFYFLAILGVLTTVVTYMFSGSIILSLYSATYSHSIEVLRILAFMLCFYFVNFLLGNALIAAGKEIYSTVTLMAGAVLNIGLDVVLIPRFGIDGAAAARVVTEAGAFILQLILLLRVTRSVRVLAFPKIGDILGYLRNE
jgi:O-antigen/teichoic acid export membrane protein